MLRAHTNYIPRVCSWQNETHISKHLSHLLWAGKEELKIGSFKFRIFQNLISYWYFSQQSGFLAKFSSLHPVSPPVGILHHTIELEKVPLLTKTCILVGFFRLVFIPFSSFTIKYFPQSHRQHTDTHEVSSGIGAVMHKIIMRRISQNHHIWIIASS